MDDIEYQAWREFKDAAGRENPEYIFTTQKNILSWQAKRDKLLRKKLKNPVHYRTGKPLNERTIQKYKADIEHTKQHLTALEMAIEMLKKYGLLGNGRKSINEVLTAYYPGEGIPLEDAPWIEALKEIKKERDERRAYRERIIHKINTCQEDCPLKDLWKDIFQD